MQVRSDRRTALGVEWRADLEHAAVETQRLGASPRSHIHRLPPIDLHLLIHLHLLRPAHAPPPATIPHLLSLLPLCARLLRPHALPHARHAHRPPHRGHHVRAVPTCDVRPEPDAHATTQRLPQAQRLCGEIRVGKRAVRKRGAARGEAREVGRGEERAVRLDRALAEQLGLGSG